MEWESKEQLPSPNLIARFDRLEPLLSRFLESAAISSLTHFSTRSSTPLSMNAPQQFAPAATAGGQQNGPVSTPTLPEDPRSKLVPYLLSITISKSRPFASH